VRDELHDDLEYPEDAERPGYHAWLERRGNAPQTWNFRPSYTHAEVWIPQEFERYIGKELRNLHVVDVGGGNGVLARPWWEERQAHLTIYDVMLPSELGNANGICADVEEIVEICGERSFDIIQCTEVIEHMRKRKGERVIELFKKVARVGILITTTAGYTTQPPQLDNPFQEHVSGWLPTEFQQLGFEVTMHMDYQIAAFWKR
jgi:2-polyprenyl-3-methyl-5-hydroxy-6-metoxy-1,4-benzoquinol methylase